MQDSMNPEPAPCEALYAPESPAGGASGMQRGSGAAPEAQTGAQSLDAADLRRALAVDAVGPALNERGEWLPLSVRQAVADAVLAAVDGAAGPIAAQAKASDGEGCTCPEPYGGPAHPECPAHGDPDVLAQRPTPTPAPEPGLREQYAAAMAALDCANFNCPVPDKGHEYWRIWYAQADAVLAVRDTELQQLREQVARVHAYLIRLCAEPHPSHDHVCPDGVRRQILATPDDPKDQP